MTGTLLSFCVMAIAARELSGEVGTFQILFIRSSIGLAVISLIIAKQPQGFFLSTQRLKLHVFRNVFHFAGQYGWFLGIGLLPLAEVFALEFTVPIWTLLISTLFLRETLNVKKVLSVLLGFMGVFVILNPGSEVVSRNALIVLIAAFCYAIAHVLTKSLAGTEHTLSVIFYMCLIQLPIGLLLAMPSWVSPTVMQWEWLLVVAFSALMAHYCLTNALRLADAGVVVTLDFLRLPSIALVGVILYGEPFDFALIIGASLMLVGNFLNLYSPARQGEKEIDL
ncbi:MAG: DMT family transporter [Gammaproteobacteria bacterium]|nr:DMT family transporter [Gammaproteobacteria bacterium]